MVSSATISLLNLKHFMLYFQNLVICVIFLMIFFQNLLSLQPCIMESYLVYMSV